MLLFACFIDPVCLLDVENISSSGHILQPTEINFARVLRCYQVTIQNTDTMQLLDNMKI